MPTWKEKTAIVCVKGKLQKNAYLDIRTDINDPASSVLYGEVTPEESCTVLRLTMNYAPASKAYIIVTGNEGLVVANLPITLPS